MHHHCAGFTALGSESFPTQQATLFAILVLMGTVTIFALLFVELTSIDDNDDDDDDIDNDSSHHLLATATSDPGYDNWESSMLDRPSSGGAIGDNVV